MSRDLNRTITNEVCCYDNSDSPASFSVNKAKDAEMRQDLGYSLTWYAIAQRYYPASTIANQAIERVSKQILVKAGP